AFGQAKERLDAFAEVNESFDGVGDRAEHRRSILHFPRHGRGERIRWGDALDRAELPADGPATDFREGSGARCSHRDAARFEVRMRRFSAAPGNAGSSAPAG